MASLLVQGNKRLSGSVRVSGNKNAALPMMCATMLGRTPSTFSNFPPISDCQKISEFFRKLGSSAEIDAGAQKAFFNHANMSGLNGYEVPSGIRSAVLLIAPMVFRLGQFRVDLGSKGCALGIREIDPHLEIAVKFGCKVTVSQGACQIDQGKENQSPDIWLDYQSVTATETFLMFAATSSAEARLMNAASEPHVAHFCKMLVKMGVEIDGIGTSRLTVRGNQNLLGCNFEVIDDHHEVATYAAIGASTCSHLTIKSSVSHEMDLIVRQFRKTGLNVRIDGSDIITGPSDFIIEKPLTPEGITKVEAAPWPYFPADILPQIIGATRQSKGEILFWNKVYEGALFWSAELAKFGARTILADPHRLILLPASELRPNAVDAPYIIRVVIGLLIAAMQIEGQSLIRSADPLNSAHPNLIEKLQSLGANLEWVPD